MQKTELTTANGTKVILNHTFLADDFCEAAKDHFAKKHKFPKHGINSFFLDKAVKEYIIDTNTQPVYEENE